MVGPHGRLGVLWAVVTVAAAAAGALWLAVWLALAAGLAGAQVSRASAGRSRARTSASGRTDPAAPGASMAIAGTGAACTTLAALAGPPVVAAAAGAVPVVAIGYVLAGRGPRKPGLRESLLLSVATVMVGLAGAAPVLLREEVGLVPVLVLLAYAMAYDAGTYVVGSGAASAWEGPAAGIAAAGTVTLAVAALFVPPFSGASPWLLGVLAAALAPIGPVIGVAFSGEGRSSKGGNEPNGRKARLPALRRLDSLLVLGPLWSLAAAVLVD